jgi:glucan phosphoethanolaminetransferase (alkaline phosphatase superfamily)
MKRLFLLLTILFSLSLTDCAAVQSWWSNFQQDPVAQTEVFETNAQVVLSSLTTAWNVILVFLPANIQAQAILQFNNAMASANHALQALMDLVQAAVDAKNNAPDFSKAIIDVNNAVQQIVAIVNTYKNQQVQPPAAGAPKLAEPPGYADAIKGATAMQHYVVKVGR